MRYISPIFCSPRMSAPRPELPSIYISSLGARRIPPSVTLPSISALIPSALRAPSRGPCNRAYGAPASPAWDLVLARSCARSHSCSNREDDDGSATAGAFGALFGSGDEHGGPGPVREDGVWPRSCRRPEGTVLSAVRT